jgi:hypothetical protein
MWITFDKILWKIRDKEEVVVNHNDLNNLQGWITDEYYHITSEQLDVVNNLSTVFYTQTNLTIDWDNWKIFKITLSWDDTFSLSNIVTWKYYTFYITNSTWWIIDVTLPDTADIKADDVIWMNAWKTIEISLFYDWTNRYWQVSEELTS